MRRQELQLELLFARVQVTGQLIGGNGVIVLKFSFH